jgi:hypothetical protein
MFVGTVLIQVASSKSVEAGIGTGPALDDIRLTAIAVGKSGAGVERPKKWSLLWLVGIAPGHFLGGMPNRADGQDECHAATSSVFGNPAENEIGNCHAAG